MARKPYVGAMSLPTQSVVNRHETRILQYSTYIVDPRKLEHGFRRISARIPYTLPQGHEDNDVPTFWLLL